ncbi:sorting nexin-29-like [Xenia sp. Carnegie-2017]|uniref:sorting nexin-29-like n=1 Tax=Xenia sp. Carnegie-2017 TaxID=2897299 RepID=UPI001F042526|nr:sorting nexin-29-like [Xenia sp. Carnegie-2017]
MLNLASVDITKQAIIDRLLDGVKQCQVRFGSTTELASEKDSRISCLCEQWNIVLQFGIKSTKKINSLRQVLMRSEGQSVFWLFIKEHLSSSEIKTYNSLPNVMTDVGRAQAWLRSSLNEQSLEKYLHSFIGHKQLLFQYYEQDALLLDDERSSMLPMMAAGLSSILFAIDIDKAEFNSITVQIPGNISQAVSRPTSIWAVPSPMYHDVHARGNHAFTKRPDDFLEMPKNSQLAYCSNSENSSLSSTMAKSNVENKENETDEQVARLTKKSLEALHLENEFKTENDLKKIIL